MKYLKIEDTLVNLSNVEEISYSDHRIAIIYKSGNTDSFFFNREDFIRVIDKLEKSNLLI